MYKKVYIEITNNCNLNCDFCIKNQRKNKFMRSLPLMREACLKDSFSIVGVNYGLA